MSVLTDILAHGFGQRALLAAVMIGFMNGMLGAYVVLRRASLFAGGLTHTLFPGIALGAVIAGLNPLSALVGSLAVALTLSLTSTGIASVSRLDRETSLAILYTAAFGGGLLVLRRLNTYIDIENYLFGNILGVSNFDLWFVYLAGFFTVSLLLLFQRPLLLFVFSEENAASQGINTSVFNYGFSALLVLTMIASLQAVGAILTLGLLIAPAAILALFSNSTRVIIVGGGLLGAVVSALSVLLSFSANIETGPSIVGVFGVLFLLAFIFSPNYGLMSVLRKRSAMEGD